MPREEDRIRVHHMREAALEAIAFCGGRTRLDLDSDRMLQHALARCLEVVGEAASKVSPDSRREIARVPWHLIVPMRNRLVHAYFITDLDIIWNTVHEDLPPLVAALEAWLAEHS